MEEVDVVLYENAAGRCPYAEWERRLDKAVRSQVRVRLARLRIGNFGDSKVIRGVSGLFELRLHCGPGYRIYFSRQGGKCIILLCGGDKSSQERDIAQAARYLADWCAREEDHG